MQTNTPHASTQTFTFSRPLYCSIAIINEPFRNNKHIYRVFCTDASATCEIGPETQTTTDHHRPALTDTDWKKLWAQAGNISPSSKTEAGGGVGGIADSSDSPVFDDSEVINVREFVCASARLPLLGFSGVCRLCQWNRENERHAPHKG